MPEPVITLEGTDAFYVRPTVLPRGEWVLASAFPSREAVIHSLVTGERRVILQDGGGDVSFLPSGHLAYVSEGSLFVAPFNLERLEVVGGGFPLIEGVEQWTNGVSQFVHSDDGLLVYQPAAELAAASLRTLVWVDRNGEEEPLGLEPGTYVMPQLSPDGRRLAVENLLEDLELFIYELDTQVLEQFTFNPASDRWPVWSPDGSQIAFVSDRAEDGTLNIYVKQSDGTGSVEQLTSGLAVAASDWIEDGNRLVYGANTGATVVLYTRSMGADAEPEQLLGIEGSAAVPSVSPDGRWLAYRGEAGGYRGATSTEARIFVRPFPDTDIGQRLVSVGIAHDPLWAPDGSELFYLTPEAAMVVSVETGETFQRGTPRPMFSMAPYFQGQNMSWDISPDGQRFLMLKHGETPESDTRRGHLVVVQNWFDEVKERVPTP